MFHPLDERKGRLPKIRKDSMGLKQRKRETERHTEGETEREKDRMRERERER